MLSFPLKRRQASQPVTTRPARSRMTIFNVTRLSIYAAVFVFTLICLGMAGSFQHVLAASDLTRFVPFAIFVCATSLFGIIILAGFGLMNNRNPITTRHELATFALIGVFWLVLGIYLSTSEAQSADVECFSSESSSEPLDDSVADFHTEQYQAMYRVLNVFALANAAIVIIASTLMLWLAIRKHRNGDQHMWYGPITSCAWLASYDKPGKSSNYRSNSQRSILPRSHSQSKGVYSEKPIYSEKPAARDARPSRERSHRRQDSGRRPSTRDANREMREHKRQNSGKSSNSAPHAGVDFENGALVEPSRAVYGSRDRRR